MKKFIPFLQWMAFLIFLFLLFYGLDWFHEIRIS